LAASVGLGLVAGRISREPDPPYVSRANRERVIDRRVEGKAEVQGTVEGTAEMVVEVVSNDRIRRGQVTIRDDHEAVGVRESRLRDAGPSFAAPRSYQLANDARYRATPLGGDCRPHSCDVLGFWLGRDSLRRSPPIILP
jgi:hypothetical protein